MSYVIKNSVGNYLAIQSPRRWSAVDTFSASLGWTPALREALRFPTANVAEDQCRHMRSNGLGCEVRVVPLKAKAKPAAPVKVRPEDLKIGDRVRVVYRYRGVDEMVGFTGTVVGGPEKDKYLDKPYYVSVKRDDGKIGHGQNDGWALFSDGTYTYEVIERLP